MRPLSPLTLPGRALPALTVALPFLMGCPPPVPPPRSVLPNVDAALERMRASAECGRGLQANDAKLDVFGDRGRVRGNMSLFVVQPAKIRMDLNAPPPLMSPVAVLTSDGQRFALFDQREKKFFIGKATACNISRLTTFQVPGHVLVTLLRGQAPVLKRDPVVEKLEWDDHGFYRITIPSTRSAEEEIHLTPNPADLALDWQKQRMRVLDVQVKQYGTVLYHVKMEGHAPAPMSKAYVDPDGIDPPIAPSGPQCEAELPRRIDIDMPAQGQDVIFKYDQVFWNPPLREGVFTQPPPGGMPIETLTCEDD